MQNIIQDFTDAMQSYGMRVVDAQIIADGQIHRVHVEGDARGSKNGWYVLHNDGLASGSFGSWRSGESSTWCARSVQAISEDEHDDNRRRFAEAKQKRDEKNARIKAAARERAAAIWERAKPAVDHIYLTNKGIDAHGARRTGNALVIPLRIGGELHSLQFVGKDGAKKFLSGGRISGCYFSIGDMVGAAALCIAEGFATGATIFQATGYPVAVGFNAGNLLLVARAMRAKFSDLPLIICADDDDKTHGNPGIYKAREAALAVDGLLAIPKFGSDRPDGSTDFNDLAKAQGHEAVRKCIESALMQQVAEVAKVVGVAVADAASGWAEPQPLTMTIDPQPYPIDALPDGIRAAVEEVAKFVQAPIPMIASSALAALSVAAQAHVDVARSERLQGPTGLFLLTIADSGERKSSCDGHFTKAIDRYELEQAKLAKPILKNYEAELQVWKAKNEGIKDKIRQLAKTGNSIDLQSSMLREHEHEMPEKPMIPRLLYADATPESLAYNLATKWPAAGILSAEGGIVLGSSGMGKESIMRNLALFNQLWDGRSLTIDRKSTESFSVKGARLTIALQVQESTLKSFFSSSGGLARGTGFLARFLISQPTSTQGSRMFTEAPSPCVHLDKFNERISEILSRPPRFDDGLLSPTLVKLNAQAKAAWIVFHDSIERELKVGGELQDVRDVASKIADNAARIAALMQIFEGNIDDGVGEGAFEGASRIAAWHLHESLRFFGGVAQPEEMADAARLDKWILAYCKREGVSQVSTKKVQQFGPGGLRDRTSIESAVHQLNSLARARIVEDGRSRVIQVNPTLLIEGVNK